MKASQIKSSLAYIQSDSKGALRVRVPGNKSKLFSRKNFVSSKEQMMEAIKYRNQFFNK